MDQVQEKLLACPDQSPNTAKAFAGQVIDFKSEDIMGYFTLFELAQHIGSSHGFYPLDNIKIVCADGILKVKRDRDTALFHVTGREANK